MWRAEGGLERFLERPRWSNGLFIEKDWNFMILGSEKQGEDEEEDVGGEEREVKVRAATAAAAAVVVVVAADLSKPISFF